MKLKVCGHQSLEDIQTTIQTGADAIGFVFAPSKRRVKPVEVAQWLQQVELTGQKLVGVFVNADFEEVASVLKKVPLDIIQCHGSETPEYMLTVKQMTGCEVWKVIHHYPNAWKEMHQFRGAADAFLVDAKVNGQWGGTGQTFAWEYIPLYLEEAAKQGVGCYIAGGVNAENVEQLVTYNPAGIDIASGSETNGVKDLDKISKIEKRVKGYEPASTR
ncbi:phosphoribosylanthranilate isomerase [Bacillus tianshenii]|nr:phosphoribosylanthranilate isomerase [Bacillus tianshenii]